MYLYFSDTWPKTRPKACFFRPYFFLLSAYNKCEIACQARVYRFYTGFGRPVKDGLPCDVSDSDDVTPTGSVCLHGQCQVSLMSLHTIKQTKWHVRPAKTHIHSFWSKSSLPAWRKVKSLATRKAHSKDWSDWGMPRLIWVFAWHTGHFVGFVLNQSM